MVNSNSSASRELQSQSVESARDNVLRFLRLIAKDVVRRLANANADRGSGAEKSGSSRPAR